VIGVGAALYMTVSFGMALSRAYGLPFGRALWRTVTVGVVYLIVVGAAIVAVVLPVVLLRR
jgi:hypothetical protein